MTDPRFPAHHSDRHAMRISPSPRPLPEPTRPVGNWPIVVAFITTLLGWHLFIDYKPDRPPIEAIAGIGCLAVAVVLGVTWLADKFA